MAQQNVHHFVEETIVSTVFKRLAMGIVFIVIVTAALGYGYIATKIRNQTTQQLKHAVVQQGIVLDESFHHFAQHLSIIQQRLQTQQNNVGYCSNQSLETQNALQTLKSYLSEWQPANVNLSLIHPTEKWQINLNCEQMAIDENVINLHFLQNSDKNQVLQWQPEITYTNSQAWLTALQPIYQQHQLQFILFAQVDIQPLLNQLDRLSWADAQSFLYNQQKQVVSHFPDLAPNLDFATIEPIWDQETEQYIASTRLQSNQWYLAIALPQKVLGQITWEIAQLILLFGVIILASVFILLYTFLQHLIAKPLHDIILATKQLGKRNFNIRLKMQRQDELGVLAKSFDKMVQHLSNHQQQLQTYAMRLENEAQQLTQLNQQLTREISERQKAQAEKEQLLIKNMQMSTELNIARRLQQLILPKSTEIKTIPQLEIATLMEAAEEVGGDYYDVLQHQGMIKIGIGDVTGHGLESGILSLMVQTAVRTLLISEQHDPIQFLSILNKTVFANIQRMGIDKELTLLMLDYHYNTLRISGQHEQVIVVRQGDLELLETDDLGFPIGLEEDIEPFISFKEVKLNEGDVVILYTDGITEAENKQGEYYGLERMCNIISEYWCKASVDICQAIVNDVEQFIDGYEILDDITLIVMKQKPECIELSH